jgi:iron-sulfur cluster repair protein YtfE (RIC family)
MEAGQRRTAAPAPSAVLDTRDMVVVHQAMRRELRLAPAAVRRAPCDDRRQVRRVARHLQQLTLGVTLHHEGEDRLLWPKLQARVPEQLVPLIDLMERQHQTVHALIEAVDALHGYLERANQFAPDGDGSGGLDLLKSAWAHWDAAAAAWGVERAETIACGDPGR